MEYIQYNNNTRHHLIPRDEISSRLNLSEHIIHLCKESIIPIQNSHLQMHEKRGNPYPIPANHPVRSVPTSSPIGCFAATFAVRDPALIGLSCKASRVSPLTLHHLASNMAGFFAALLCCTCILGLTILRSNYRYLPRYLGIIYLDSYLSTYLST